MPKFSNPPDPPRAGEPTDAEVARHLLARCRELASLADLLNNPELSRLLREASEKTGELLAENDEG